MNPYTFRTNFRRSRFVHAGCKTRATTWKLNSVIVYACRWQNTEYPDAGLWCTMRESNNMLSSVWLRCSRRGVGNLRQTYIDILFVIDTVSHPLWVLDYSVQSWRDDSKLRILCACLCLCEEQTVSSSIVFTYSSHSFAKRSRHARTPDVPGRTNLSKCTSRQCAWDVCKGQRRRDATEH